MDVNDVDGFEALSLWSQMCEEPSRRGLGWIAGDGPPTFVPFDRLTIIQGVEGIVAHLARRDRTFGASKIVCHPIASWREGEGVLVVAEAFMMNAGEGGAAEVRRMMLLIAATTGNDRKLRHVSEAVPAVLPLVIEAYSRPIHRRTAP